MKVIISIILIIVMLQSISQCSLDTSDDTTQPPDTSTDPLSDIHNQIYDDLNRASPETPYANLYLLYTKATKHKETHKCSLDADSILEYMIYGQWKDKNNNFITYTLNYTNYNNTKSNSLFSTNLPNSKISGNTYFYYTKVENGNLIIGYKDQITEEKTDNFSITFTDNSILVLNKINNTNYTLTLNKEYDKVHKGNARLAYIYIAKKALEFNYPSSIYISDCYVDYENKIVYARIVDTYILTGEYAFYEENGRYYMVEYTYNFESSNVDITELNQKVKEYIISAQ